MAGTMLAEAAAIKGDLPGHPFRGNQWSGGSGISTSSDVTGLRSEDLSGWKEDAKFCAGMAIANATRSGDPSEAIVGRVDGELVGIMSWTYNGRSPETSDALSVDWLATKRTGEGLGVEMMLAVCRKAASMGKGVELEATDSAIKFYEKFGMTDVGRNKMTLTAEETKALVESHKSWKGDLRKLEPSDGVFAVSQKQKTSRLAIAKHLLSVATQAVQLKRLLLKDQLRNAVVKAVHVKQYEETERELAEAVSELIKRQYASAGRNLAGTKDEFSLWTKGDLPGHPFRGNQWTEGQGGSATPADKLEAYHRLNEEARATRSPKKKDELKEQAMRLFFEAQRESGLDPKSPEWKQLVEQAKLQATKPAGKPAEKHSSEFPNEQLLPPEGEKFIDTQKMFGTPARWYGTELSEGQIDQLDNNRGMHHDVPSGKLIPTQSDIGVEKVKKLAREWDDKKAIVSLVEENGEYFIYDGHHTAAAALLLGKTKIRANVVSAKEAWDDEASVGGILTKSVHAEDIFDPRDWDSDLVDTCLPVLMRKAGEAAAAQMLIMGVDVAPRKKVGKTEKGGPGSGDKPGHPFRGNQWSGGAGGGLSNDAASDLISRASSGQIHEGGREDVLDKRDGHLYRGYTFKDEESVKEFLTSGNLGGQSSVYGKTVYFADDPSYATSHIRGEGFGVLVEVKNDGESFEQSGQFQVAKGDANFRSVTRIAVLKAQLDSSIWGAHSRAIMEIGQQKSPSFLSTKASRATEWLLALEDEGEDLSPLWPEVFALPGGGTVDLGFATEWPSWMKDEIGRQMKETFEQPFWAGINDTTASGIQSHVLKGLEEGLSIREIQQQMVGDGLDEYYRNRGINIARTECLPANTVVNGANVLCVHKRWYSGPWVEVVTKAGRKFSGTPNHPMLTKRGMVAIGDLVETDDLVCHCFSVEQSGSAGDENVEHPPTTIGQIFDSLAAVGVIERRRCTQPDFHGDGMDGYVDVFHSNGPLLYGSHSPVNKSIIHLILPEASMGEGSLSAGSPEADRFVPSVDSRLGSVAEMSSTLDDNSLHGCGVNAKNSSQLGTGFPSLIPSSDFGTREVLGTGSVASVKHQFASGFEVPSRDAKFLTSPKNDCLVATENLSHFDDTESRLVEFDHPLVIRRIESWSGHVYNLTTVEGYFIIAGGVYTGNSGNALNGARSAAMDRLQEEVPGLRTKKTWMSVLGTTTRDSHANLDGVPASRNGTWLLDGYEIPWPAHFSLPPGSRCNCQCSLVQSWGMSSDAAEQLIEDYNQRLNEERAARDFWTKGDYAGHPFRGNQWTGGRGDAGIKWRQDWHYDEIPLTKVKIGDLYSREQDTWSQNYKEGIGAERVQSLADKMREGQEITAVPVRPHKDGYIIVDGTHRTYAAQSLGADEIWVQIISDEPYISSAPSARFGEITGGKSPSFLTWLKHLAGMHDQSSHGRGGSVLQNHVSEMISHLETIFKGPGRAAAVNEVLSAAKFPEYLKGILQETPGVDEIRAVVEWSVRRGRIWEAV